MCYGCTDRCVARTSPESRSSSHFRGHGSTERKCSYGNPASACFGSSDCTYCTYASQLHSQNLLVRWISIDFYHRFVSWEAQLRLRCKLRCCSGYCPIGSRRNEALERPSGWKGRVRSLVCRAAFPALQRPFLLSVWKDQAGVLVAVPAFDAPFSWCSRRSGEVTYAVQRKLTGDERRSRTIVSSNFVHGRQKSRTSMSARFHKNEGLLVFEPGREILHK